MMILSVPPIRWRIEPSSRLVTHNQDALIPWVEVRRNEPPRLRTIVQGQERRVLIELAPVEVLAFLFKTPFEAIPAAMLQLSQWTDAKGGAAYNMATAAKINEPLMRGMLAVANPDKYPLESE